MNTYNKYFTGAIAAMFIVASANTGFGQSKLFEKGGVNTLKGPQWVPGEIIVKYKAGVSADVIRDLNKDHGGSVLSLSQRGQFRRLRIPRNKSVWQMVDIYKKNPNVEYVEPNFIIQALLSPNDPYYSFQWHLDNNTYGGIHMSSAWDVHTGDPGVIVAIVDSGIAYENFGKRYKRAPDLADTSFVPGFDFINNDTHPNDDNSHGTHVAGTVAQSTNNAKGVAGIAFNTSLMPVKVLNKNGSGSSATVADGIYFAADNGAAVINLSLGSSSPSTTIENALAYAYNKGVTIVCAAGNEFQSGNAPLYPAAFNDYCIAVSATRYDETKSYYSNTGSYVDIAAPGGDLTVDQNNDGYGDGVLQQTFGNKPSDFGYWFFQGTSMATPHVAGVAALLIAKGITGPANVRAALESSAEDKGTAGWDEVFGHGLLDAAAAFNYSAPLVHDVAINNIAAPSLILQGDSAGVVVNAVNQGDYEETFLVTLTDTTDSLEIGNQLISLSAKETMDINFNWNTTFTTSLGDHVLSAEAATVLEETDTADNTMTTTVAVQEPTHDVAVLALDSPLEAFEGDTVVLTVTVENQGTFEETPLLSINDETDGVLIGSVNTVLPSGTLTQFFFNWDTIGATIADHTLKAELNVVPGETDTGDNSTTMITTIKEVPLATPLHVAKIDMSLSTRSAGPKNKFTKAVATVTISDANGPVEGATVSSSWSDATSDIDSGLTDASGLVTLESNEVKNASGGTTYTFAVDDVVKSGLTYDASSNIETSDSISVP